MDAATGNPLQVNTVYFTDIASTNESGPGMFYTTDTAGAGSVGTTTFVDLNPGSYTNLSFSAEVNGSAAGATNYFAIEEGGTWYVSTTPLTGSVGLTGAQFSNNVVPYTNLASAWNLLTVNAANVVIGAQAGANLSGPIQGFGIVELPTGGGWNYNQLAITAFVPNPPPPVPATITGHADQPDRVCGWRSTISRVSRGHIAAHLLVANQLGHVGQWKQICRCGYKHVDHIELQLG